jgi:hypothetical protein
MTFAQAHPRPLLVDRNALHSSIERAFVESRYARPPRPWLVDIYHDGAIVLTDPAMPPLHGVLPLLSVTCNGAPEQPSNAIPVDGVWSRAEFHEWVCTRTDLYLHPTLDVLFLRAHALGVELTLTDR